MTDIITCQELNDRLATRTPLLIIDVLPPEVYAAQHLPGAENACVYEVIFLETVASLGAGSDTTIVLYDATGTTMAAPTAREKLLAKGYRDVRVLSGGLAGWSAAGFPVDRPAPPPVEPFLRDGIYRIDTAASVLEWTGRNFNNRHYGRIPFSSGEVVIERGMIRSGEISLDMTAISNIDLVDADYRQMLINHLKSEDFFDVARFPFATMVINGSTPIDDATPGTPGRLVRGELTVKGVSRDIEFPTALAAQEDGSVKAQAIISLDRTDWNINYGSGRLFEKLGMHLVHDRIDLELFIVATRGGQAR